MTYYEGDDLEHSQLVMTGHAYQNDIMKALGLTHRDSLQKGLKALCDCNAIRRVSRGVYQINPKYAGKGQWKFNPKVSQSSLETFTDYYEGQKQKTERGKSKLWIPDIDTPKINKSKKPDTKEPKPKETGTEKSKTEISAGQSGLDIDHWHN